MRTRGTHPSRYETARMVQINRPKSHRMLWSASGGFRRLTWYREYFRWLRSCFGGVKWCSEMFSCIQGVFRVAGPTVGCPMSAYGWVQSLSCARTLSMNGFHHWKSSIADVLKPRGSPPPSNRKTNTFLLNPGPNTDPSSQKKVLHLAQINLGIISCLEMMNAVRRTSLERQHTSP
jgi:hypothetical protein